MTYRDTLKHNYGNFAKPNHFQFEYERWYSVVWQLTIARTPVGGHVLWLNGNKVMDYNDMITIGNSGTFSEMKLYGTIAQPKYDAPPHYRKLEAMIVTDNWQDIIDGGYINQSSDSIPPLPPQGLKVNE